MAGTLIPTRDQLKRWCSDSQGTDEDLLRKIEQVFFGVEQIPGLEDGVDNNTLAISTLSDLVRPITIDPIQPLSAQISSNTTYTLTGGEATEGMKTVLIPSAYLVASAGGPFTLTITTGLGTTETVTISAAGSTIVSGDLIFNIQVDASGNVNAQWFGYTVLDSLGEGIISNNGRRYPSLVDDSRVTTGTTDRTETVRTLEIGQTALINWACGVTGGVARTITFALPDVPATADTYQVSGLAQQAATNTLTTAAAFPAFVTFSSFGASAGGVTLPFAGIASGNTASIHGYVKRLS